MTDDDDDDDECKETRQYNPVQNRMTVGTQVSYPPYMLELAPKLLVIPSLGGLFMNEWRTSNLKGI